MIVLIFRCHCSNSRVCLILSHWRTLSTSALPWEIFILLFTQKILSVIPDCPYVSVEKKDFSYKVWNQRLKSSAFFSQWEVVSVVYKWNILKYIYIFQCLQFWTGPSLIYLILFIITLYVKILTQNVYEALKCSTSESTHGLCSSLYYHMALPWSVPCGVRLFLAFVHSWLARASPARR